MNYKLFLEDSKERTLQVCYRYMRSRIGNKANVYLESDWVTVRSYKDFMAYIMENGVPEVVSFDHDLRDEHYKAYLEGNSEYTEETGLQCAIWLLEYCEAIRERFPKYLVHSMNVVGAERIERLLGPTKRLHGTNQIN